MRHGREGSTGSYFSIPFTDADRSVVTVIFHSTSLRDSQFEVKVKVPFLKDGAFIAQSVATYPTSRAIRKLGSLDAPQFGQVERCVFKWLGKAS